MFFSSVDSIISSFKRQSAKLRALAKAKRVSGGKHHRRAERSRRTGDDHHSEAMRAELVATNIDNLIGVS